MSTRCSASVAARSVACGMRSATVATVFSMIRRPRGTARANRPNTPKVDIEYTSGLFNRSHTPEAKARISAAQRARHAERQRRESHERAVALFYVALQTHHTGTRNAVLHLLAMECLRTAAPEDRPRWNALLPEADDLVSIKAAQDLLATLT
jgi:hypothetical protein